MEISYGPSLSCSPDCSSSRPNLRYRRQFAAAFAQSDRFPDWQHCELPEYGLHIYAHPDLELSMAFAGDKGIRLVLLGYTIDPDYPERSNQDIVNALTAFPFESVEDIADEISRLGGRFVIFASLLDKLCVFHDACGLRSVFYAKVSGKVFLASQPLLLSEFFPLNPSDQYSSFYHSAYKKNRDLYYLPAGITLFENISQLITIWT